MTQPAADGLTPTVWSRFVAIGDSFTEGMCDDDPTFGHDGEFAGWADRLAAHLSEIARAEGVDFGYANLAVRGRKLADVVGPQLEDALALQPDLVSIVGGGNDILRPKADLDGLAARLEAAVARIRGTGADVLMATPVDPADAPLVKATRGRAAIHTANIWSIARRNGAHVVDQWGLHALRDWRMWSQDRIHMTTEGHRRVSLAALEALGHSPAETGLGHAARARAADRSARGVAGQCAVGEGVRRALGAPPPHRAFVRRPPSGEATRRLAPSTDGSAPPASVAGVRGAQEAPQRGHRLTGAAYGNKVEIRHEPPEDFLNLSGLSSGAGPMRMRGSPSGHVRGRGLDHPSDSVRLLTRGRTLCAPAAHQPSYEEDSCVERPWGYSASPWPLAWG